MENLGLWEVFADPAGPDNGAEATVNVPVNVAAGGKLLLSAGWVNFTAPSSLTVAGELEVQSGGRLRVDGSTPARDLMLTAGSLLSGTGTVRLEGANRVVLTGDVILGIGLLDMADGTSITGAFTLTIAAGSILQMDHSSTFPGSVTVDGALKFTSSSATLTIIGSLALNASGTLNNPGAIHVGLFVNAVTDNSNVIGNVPVLISSFQGLLHIALFGSPASTDSGLRSIPIAGRSEVLLWWNAQAHMRFTVESSLDLVRWQQESVLIEEPLPGSYQTHLDPGNHPRLFYRVHEL